MAAILCGVGPRHLSHPRMKIPIGYVIFSLSSGLFGGGVDMATGPTAGQGVKNRGKPPALSVQNTSKSPVETGLSDICGSWHVNSDESQDSEPGRVHRPPRLNPSLSHRGSPDGGYVKGALPLCLVNDRPDARLSFTPAAWPGFVFRRCAAVPLGLPPDMRGARSRG